MTHEGGEEAPFVAKFADQNILGKEDHDDQQRTAVKDRGHAEEKEDAALAFAGGWQINIVAEQIFLRPGAEECEGFLAEIVNIQELGEGVVAVCFD